MSFMFRMTIGDWSGDGHSHYENFTIKSNIPVEIVREAHLINGNLVWNM